MLKYQHNIIKNSESAGNRRFFENFKMNVSQVFLALWELVLGNPTIFCDISIYQSIYRDIFRYITIYQVQNRRYIKKQNRYIADFGPDISWYIIDISWYIIDISRYINIFNYIMRYIAIYHIGDILRDLFIYYISRYIGYIFGEINLSENIILK